MLSRRDFIKWSAITGAWVYVSGVTGCARRVEPRPGPAGKPKPRPSAAARALDPETVPKFRAALLIPPAMPRAKTTAGGDIDYFEISMRQFDQQVLPSGLPKTTVWGYGPASAAESAAPMIHNAPSLTIEARAGVPTRVKWINELVGDDGAYLPHLLPVDPTLHWANPAGGTEARDSRPVFDKTPERYTGPVPVVTHVHGAVRVGDESDGYAEAWFLPKAEDIPDGFAAQGSWYDFFAAKAKSRFGAEWGEGFAVFQYPNDNRASTLWYHDHTLGMTRLNVYAGPAGFYLVRGGDAGDDAVLDSRSGKPAKLPAPAPAEGDEFPSKKAYHEIPIAIQDRAFNDDGSLFYPDSREFFDEIVGPFIPEKGGFSPLWNPEFFGNTLIVNGATWPFLEVERRRYRLRLLNGCQSRFLILDFSRIPGVKVHQIGNEGGFLAKPVDLMAHKGRLLMALAERADVIVDFTDVKPGEYVLGNMGPDEPFGGGEPGEDFDPAHPETTGQVLQFRVSDAAVEDDSTPGEFLKLPKLPKLPKESVTRRLALIEQMGMGKDRKGKEVEGPSEAVLGVLGKDGMPAALEWASPVTENPAPGATEIWEIYNTTGDAHPMHVHETVFEVVDRQELDADKEEEELRMPLRPVGDRMPPEPWERGFKDTVIAYPGQVTRIKATFGEAGQYAWHCHIVEHEDNEMMRPYRIGPVQIGEPKPKKMNDTNDQPMPAED
ncbi:MAG TPA: multicopper oxidase [Coriobacteriia bacterium]|nr:multicopper oxidase [Coriobacteriia bacterium]